MNAIVYEKYGPPEVLQLKSVKRPVPKHHEVLIKVHATTVTAGDCELRDFSLPFSVWWLPVRLYMGALKPRFKILGQELSGEIVAIGKRVTRFQIGDTVFGAATMKLGTYAEYICLPEAGAIVEKPTGLSYRDATTIATGGLNGLHFVRKANIQSGEKVIIVGAGGSIGTYAVQIAKLHGAEVTCVDSPEKLSMLQSVGADHVINYTEIDFTQTGVLYDVIIEIAGKSSYAKCLRSLKPRGRLIIGNPELTWLIRGMFTKIISGKRVINALAGYRTEDLVYITELIAEGKVRPVIDRTYLLDQMQEAHRYVGSGEKKGNLVIMVDGNKDHNG